MTLEPNRVGNLVAPIERRSIPLRQISRRGIRVLQKPKNRVDGIFRISRIGIVQNKLAHIRVEAALARKHRFNKAFGNGRRVGIKCGVAVSAVARPETCADHLMRVRFRLN